MKCVQVLDVTQVTKLVQMSDMSTFLTKIQEWRVFALIFFHLLAQKPNIEQFSIYSNKFFHNFHLSESRFTCLGPRARGLAWRLRIRSWGHEALKYEFRTQYNTKSSLSEHFIFVIQYSSWLFFLYY